ncbi:MAG: peptidylprolyl isomerase [Caldisericia bacterium]|nr:peptidylprolyl isomerase [Caldisericia bacterium]
MKVKRRKILKINLMKFFVPIAIVLIIGIFTFDIYSKRDIAAIVCGEKIYKGEVEAAVNRKIKEYQSDKITLTDIEIAAIRKQILNDLIEDVLLDTYAKEHNITVTEEEIKNEIQRMREYTGLSEDEVYKQALSKYQLLESDINEMVRSALLADKVYYEVIKDLNISDEELWEYFIKRVKFYDGSRRVSHIFIVVDTQKDTIDDINSKFEKMKKIREEILKGKKFEDLVKEYSEDLSTKDKGGDLFWFRKGTISDSEISKVVFSLNKGEISEVVKSQYGFHIFKITDSVPENLSSLKEVEIKNYFEKIKELVKIDALYQKSDEKIKEFNKSLWEIYKKRIKIGNTWDKIINIMNNFLKKLEGS